LSGHAHLGAVVDFPELREFRASTARLRRRG
jgi:hypothetical protein